VVWIFFLVAAVGYLVAGVGGSLLLYAQPEKLGAIADLLPKLENFGVAGGLALSMLGIALAYRKLARIERIMGGRSATGRVRRGRISRREGGEDDEAGDAEGDDDPSGAATRKASGRTRRTRTLTRTGEDGDEASGRSGSAGAASHQAGSPTAGTAAVSTPSEVSGNVRHEAQGAPPRRDSTRANMRTYEAMRQAAQGQARQPPEQQTPEPARQQAPTGGAGGDAPSASPAPRITGRTRLLKRQLMQEAQKKPEDDEGETGLLPKISGV